MAFEKTASCSPIPGITTRPSGIGHMQQLLRHPESQYQFPHQEKDLSHFVGVPVVASAADHPRTRDAAWRKLSGRPPLRKRAC